MISAFAAAAAAQAPAVHRVAYGSEPLQFGEIRVPARAGPHPLAVILHGGCWSSAYGLDLMAPVAEALRRDGIATWNVEYRRVGDRGGGWPGTFEDVARGVDHVTMLAGRYPIDATRVVLVGHSAGGHLALWAAARRTLPARSPNRSEGPRVRGVVALGGITDLRAYGAGGGGCNRGVAALLGGTAAEVPERYAQASPLELLPLRVPQRLVQGRADYIVPLTQGTGYATAALRAGDDVRVRTVDGAGHFDLIAPSTPAWAIALAEIRDLLRR